MSGGVSFSHNNQYIVSGSQDNLLKLWDIEGRCIRDFKGHTDVVYNVKFNHTDTYIVSASQDATLKLWNLEGKLIKTYEGHQEAIVGVAFSIDDRYIISGSTDSTIKIWDADPNSPHFGECINTIEQKINCKGMKIQNAKGLEVDVFKVKDEKAEEDWKTRKGTLKEWLIERGAVD